MDSDKPVWARVKHDVTGNTGWLNLQTREVVSDHKMISLLEASNDGVICGDPLESSEWVSAEKNSEEALGVSVR